MYELIQLTERTYYIKGGEFGRCWTPTAGS